MSNRTTITLPDAETIIERMRAVTPNQSDEVFEKICRTVAKNAGQERVGAGVILMLLLAVHDATQGYPAILTGLVSTYVPEWAAALTEDSAEVQADAAAHWALVNG